MASTLRISSCTAGSLSPNRSSALMGWSRHQSDKARASLSIANYFSGLRSSTSCHTCSSWKNVEFEFFALRDCRTLRQSRELEAWAKAEPWQIPNFWRAPKTYSTQFSHQGTAQRPHPWNGSGAIRRSAAQGRPNRPDWKRKKMRRIKAVLSYLVFCRTHACIATIYSLTPKHW